MKTIYINGVEVTAPVNVMLRILWSPSVVEWRFDDWEPDFTTKWKVEIGDA